MTIVSSVFFSSSAQREKNMTHGIRKPCFSKENGVFCWVGNETVPAWGFFDKGLYRAKGIVRFFIDRIYPVSPISPFFYDIRLANCNLSTVFLSENIKVRIYPGLYNKLSDNVFNRLNMQRNLAKTIESIFCVS